MSRDIGKEQNFDEALKNVHKCFQVGQASIRDSVKDVLGDAKIQDVNQKDPYWLLATALSRFFAS